MEVGWQCSYKGQTGVRRRVAGDPASAIEMENTFDEKWLVLPKEEKLWGCRNPEVMNKALSMHDETLRILLPQYSGFEVTTEGVSHLTVSYFSPFNISWPCLRQ